MKNSCLILVLCLISAASFAQKKKTIKKHNIRSIVVTETFGTKTLNDNKSFYNANGELVQEINYDKDGKFKSDKRYKYNKEGDVTEEAEYDEAGNLVEKHLVKYDAMGEKSEEQTLDKNGKQLKRITYTYNSKGLKTERKTYDTGNNLISTKKTVYTYK